MFSLIPELGTEKQLVLCQYGPRPTEMASFFKGRLCTVRSVFL